LPDALPIFPIQVFRQTHSSLAVGMVGLAQLGPLIGFSLIGGALADAVDRRRQLLVVQILSMATSAGLALNAAVAHPPLWPVYVLAACSAGFTGVDMQTRNALAPKLVRPAPSPAASALYPDVRLVGL